MQKEKRLKPVTIELSRAIFRKYGTYGTIKCGDFRCFSVELPWLGNIIYHSCIPEGTYKWHTGEFSRATNPYPDLELEDVPGRTSIELHRANSPSELWGCIAPATSLQWRDTGMIYGTNSRIALDGLLDAIGDEESGYIWIHNERI